MTAVETRCIHEMLTGQCSICAHHPDDRLYEAAALGTAGRPPRIEPPPRVAVPS